MKALPPPTLLPVPARQLSMPLDSLNLRGMSPPERRLVVARLATLLMATAGVATGERDHDGQ